MGDGKSVCKEGKVSDENRVVVSLSDAKEPDSCEEGEWGKDSKGIGS